MLKFFIKDSKVEDAFKAKKDKIFYECISLEDYPEMTAIDITAEEKKIYPILNNFYIDKREVSVETYYRKTSQLLGSSLFTIPQENSADFNDEVKQYPAVGVSFKEAQCYCDLQHKRLPTEEEWNLRLLLKSDIRQDTIGFRCVKDLPKNRKKININCE